MIGLDRTVIWLSEVVLLDGLLLLSSSSVVGCSAI